MASSTPISLNTWIQQQVNKESKIKKASKDEPQVCDVGMVEIAEVSPEESTLIQQIEQLKEQMSEITQMMENMSERRNLFQQSLQNSDSPGLRKASHKLPVPSTYERSSFSVS